MSDASKAAPSRAMPFFERNLSLWIALAIGGGIALGEMAPGLFQLLASLEYAHINLPVAVLIWAMIYPMMIGVDPSSLMRVAEQPKGLVITLLVIKWPAPHCEAVGRSATSTVNIIHA